MFKKVACLAVLGAAVASNGAFAAQVDSPMAVTATVTGTCLLTANPMTFSNSITTLAAAVTAASTLDLDCTAGIPYKIGMGAGNNGLGFPNTTRRMSDGASHFMTYDVYIDAGYGNRFDDVITGGAANTISANGAGAISIPIYGKIPTQTTPPAGTYSDSLMVSVTY